MSYKLFIIFILNILCSSVEYNSTYINIDNFSIKNAFYIIRNIEGNLNLDFNLNFEFMNSKSNLKKNFEISKYNNNSEIFYFIKDKEKNVFLSAEPEGDHLKTYSNNTDISYALWNITPKINQENKLIYYIQNKANKCFWELINNNNISRIKLNKISEAISLNKNNEFLFIELFEEVVQINSSLLEKEPIDVLIKYIDLNDISLNRTGIHQIKKDFDNSELRYSVRSILQNIPWIRKIFILMPNEKVRYFKPKEEIKDKIIYVKDKDLLGFDSENSCTFQYNLYKMKQFGLSENFILMDDDYFIAQKINKNEMFYEENGEIYPAIISSDFYEMNKEVIIQQIEEIKKKRQSDNPHASNGFYISQKKSLLFLYDLFGNDDKRYGKKLIEPAFSHNAIPMKISDIEEIHKYIYDIYEFGKIILNEKERSMKDLQFQTLYLAYIKNKYNRKVYKISSEFYDLSQGTKILKNTKKLFVINTSLRKYFPILYLREKETLERLFPIKTKYELEEEKENLNYNLMLQSVVDSIIDLLVNKINNRINFDSQEFLKEYILGKLQKYLEEKDYKTKFLKEIKYMKEQCHKQEIINFILVALFIIMLIYRYITKGYCK